MADEKDILKKEDGKLPEDKLMAYFEGKLSPEEQHEVEHWLAEEGMEADALEGLQAIPVNEAKAASLSINHQLSKELSKKKRKRKTSVIKTNSWAWVAVVIILLLAILAFTILRMIIRH